MTLNGYDCTFAIRDEIDRLNFETTIAAQVAFENTYELTEIEERGEYVRLTVVPTLVPIVARVMRP